MIQSMTGFAERFFNTKAFSLKITIKSLNHRFLDWNFRGQKLGELENRLRTLCQENISRGRIEIFLDIQISDPTRWEVRINEDLLAKILERLDRISGRVKRDIRFSIDHIFGIPHVIELDRKDLTSAEHDFIALCFDKTLKDLIRMRRQEGRRLKSDIMSHIKAVRQAVREIERLSLKQPRLIRRKLEDRIGELGKDADVPKEKIVEEAAYLAQRYDLSEEIERLKSHLAYVRELLFDSNPDPVGKKLDFVAQELFREANTINSKAQDFAIIQHSLTIKSELESIRQQVQNLE